MFNSIIRFIAMRMYWTGAMLGHFVAKFKLGYNTFNNWEKPGNWGN